MGDNIPRKQPKAKNEQPPDYSHLMQRFYEKLFNIVQNKNSASAQEIAHLGQQMKAAPKSAPGVRYEQDGFLSHVKNAKTTDCLKKPEIMKTAQDSIRTFFKNTTCKQDARI